MQETASARAREARLLVRDARGYPGLGQARCASRSGRRSRTADCWRHGNEPPAATLFIDRDGTLVEEPPDEQVDSLEKIRFMPGVFAALKDLKRHGYRLVMVTNQDGLGTDSFPQAGVRAPQEFILETLRSQGIEFDAVFVCPHSRATAAVAASPKPAWWRNTCARARVDLAASAVVGDRDTDLQFAANLGVRGVRVRAPRHTGRDLARGRRRPSPHAVPMSTGVRARPRSMSA